MLRELPNKQASLSMPELLDVLQATGRREQVGSATAFNHSIKESLGTASPSVALFNMARSLGASYLTRAGDATRRAAWHGNLKTLADMFTGPSSVEMIRAATQRSPQISVSEALLRSALESGGTIFDPAGQRH
ncbi:hypothetical protein [Mesorhizobium sp. M0816]|uniref:hypothetical protein n=1 Tax=Mesorhizobium sp. M0816 TaxID=2957006 RepID=UPI00333987FF